MLKPTGETLVCKESATADDLFESDWQNSVRRPAPVFPVAPAPDVTGAHRRTRRGGRRARRRSSQLPFGRQTAQGPKVRRLSAEGNWIRTLGSARDRPRLRGFVVHLSAQKSWRSAEGTHSARGTSTATDVGRASQEGGLRFGLCRDRQGTRPHHSAGRPRDGRVGDGVRRR